LFRRIVEQHATQRIARILSANEVREGESDAFSRGETIFTVQNHAVAAVKQQNGCARALIFGLMNVQVRVFEIERKVQAFAFYRREQGGAHIEIQHITELVHLCSSARIDPGRQLTRVVRAKTGFAERTKQVLKSLVAEKVEGLVGHFEMYLRPIPAFR